MANRFPLIVDTSDSNKIKELPSGDSLDLAGSGIVNAASIETAGTLTAHSIVVNGNTLSTVALTGNYEDLNNAPQGFSGDYNDLANKPTIPTTTRTLNDVQNIEPNDGDILQYNAVGGRYEPVQFSLTADLANNTLDDIGDVVATGVYTDKFLKFYSGAWRPSNIAWTDVQNRPTLLSQLTNDVGFITEADDDQTLTFENGTLTISNGTSVNISNMDLTGSVFADDSTLLVDAVNGEIPGYVKIANLKTALQDGAGDYAAFKAWVLANL
jgi:hypothetical protein